jgi:S1-C subfamily serine protease
LNYEGSPNGLIKAIVIMRTQPSNCSKFGFNYKVISPNDYFNAQHKTSSYLKKSICFNFNKKTVNNFKTMCDDEEVALKYDGQDFYYYLEATQIPKKKKPKKQTPSDEKIVAAASGTGFFVSRSGHIITNHHVIEGCDAVKVSFIGDEIKAKTLAVDKMNDLAILKSKITPLKVYSVATEDASLLENVIIAGYPLGKKVSSSIKTSKGSITSLAGYGDNFSEFQTDAALNQGNSGGPIMNQKGNVVRLLFFHNLQQQRLPRSLFDS